MGHVILEEPAAHDDGSCDHDWVGSGMIQPTLVPAYAVVCPKCLREEWRRFGRGKPRISWLEHFRLVGVAPPVVRGRDMTKPDRPAVPDGGDDE